MRRRRIRRSRSAGSKRRLTRSPRRTRGFPPAGAAVFPGGGLMRPVKQILRVERGGKDITKKDPTAPRADARPDTTFLVTNMMRSVLNEGTAASARGLGFTLDGAGKTGTTNDLR